MFLNWIIYELRIECKVRKWSLQLCWQVKRLQRNLKNSSLYSFFRLLWIFLKCQQNDNFFRFKNIQLYKLKGVTLIYSVCEGGLALSCLHVLTVMLHVAITYCYAFLLLCFLLFYAFLLLHYLMFMLSCCLYVLPTNKALVQLLGEIHHLCLKILNLH